MLNNNNRKYVKSTIKVNKGLPSPDGSAPLIYIVNNAAAQDSEKIESIYKLRTKLYTMRSTIGHYYKRVRPCGRYPIADAQTIPACKGVSGKLFYSSLQTCKSVWACPICSLKINQQRQKEVRELLTNYFNQGCKGTFLTLTIPHYEADNLKHLQKVISNVYRDITASRQYKTLKRLYDFKGYIRALEVTKGSNGWHPHLHVAFVFGAGVSSDRCLQFGEKYFHLWQSLIYKHLGRLPGSLAFKNKMIYSQEGITEYITKWDLAKELTEGHTRKEGKEGRTPFQIMSDFLESGDQEQLQTFLYFCKAFKGVRQITYSRDFKIKEMSEEEIVKDEEIADILFKLDYQLFKKLHKNNEQIQVLKLYELHGLEAVTAYLEQHYNTKIDNEIYTTNTKTTPTNKYNYATKNHCKRLSKLLRHSLQHGKKGIQEHSGLPSKNIKADIIRPFKVRGGVGSRDNKKDIAVFESEIKD